MRIETHKYINHYLHMHWNFFVKDIIIIISIILDFINKRIKS